MAVACITHDSCVQRAHCKLIGQHMRAAAGTTPVGQPASQAKPDRDRCVIWLPPSHPPRRRHYTLKSLSITRLAWYSDDPCTSFDTITIILQL